MRNRLESIKTICKINEAMYTNNIIIKKLSKDEYKAVANNPKYENISRRFNIPLDNKDLLYFADKVFEDFRTNVMSFVSGSEQIDTDSDINVLAFTDKITQKNNFLIIPSSIETVSGLLNSHFIDAMDAIKNTRIETLMLTLKKEIKYIKGLREEYDTDSEQDLKIFNEKLGKFYVRTKLNYLLSVNNTKYGKLLDITDSKYGTKLNDDKYRQISETIKNFRQLCLTELKDKFNKLGKLKGFLGIDYTNRNRDKSKLTLSDNSINTIKEIKRFCKSYLKNLDKDKSPFKTILDYIDLNKLSNNWHIPEPKESWKTILAVSNLMTAFGKKDTVNKEILVKDVKTVMNSISTLQSSVETVQEYNGSQVFKNLIYRVNRVNNFALTGKYFTTPSFNFSEYDDEEYEEDFCGTSNVNDCPNCGTQLGYGANFCSHCGTQL